jgi:hypothetical protein
MSDSTRFIELRGGPADGKVMPWKHGDYPLLEVPIRTKGRLSYALYTVDGDDPSRYVFVMTRDA